MSRTSATALGIFAAVFLTALSFAQTVTVPLAALPVATIQLA